MRRVLIVTLMSMAALACLAGGQAWANDDAAANRLAVEARLLHDEAAATEDAAARLALLERALKNLEAIVRDHPGSYLAVRIVGGGRVAGLSRSKLTAAVEDIRAKLTRAAEEAQCRASPTPKCVISMAFAAADGNMLAVHRASALREIAVALAQAGDTEGARITRDKALAAARDLVWEDRARALAALSKVQKKAGDIAGARTTIAEARTELTEALAEARGRSYDWQRARALAAVAEAQTEAGDTMGARTTIAEALAVARGISISYEKWRRAETLAAVAEAQAQTGDVVGARTTIAEALAVARAIEPKWASKRTGTTGVLTLDPGGANFRAGAMAAVGAAQAKTGETIGARTTFAEALAAARSVEPGSRAYSLQILAEAQADAGDIPGAFDTANEIESARERALALKEIGVAQIQAGDIEGARTTLAEALAATHDIRIVADRGWPLMGIAEAQTEVLLEVATAQSKAGDITGALETAESIAEPYPRVSALTVIARKLAAGR